MQALHVLGCGQTTPQPPPRASTAPSHVPLPRDASRGSVLPGGHIHFSAHHQTRTEFDASAEPSLVTAAGQSEPAGPRGAGHQGRGLPAPETDAGRHRLPVPWAGTAKATGDLGEHACPSAGAARTPIGAGGDPTHELPTRAAPRSTDQLREVRDRLDDAERAGSSADQLPIVRLAVPTGTELQLL